MKKILFLCSNCGYQSSKWLGKCPECGTWNTFIEEEIDSTRSRHGAAEGINAGGKTSAVLINDIKKDEKERSVTNISEFDRVVGGIIPGQTILLSGEPGIGKSTLIIEAAGELAKQNKVYYINGEESNSQIKLRASRLGIESQNLYLFSENNIHSVISKLKKDTPSFVFVDSIQTVFSPDYESLPGTIVQMRETAYQLVTLCKEMNISLIIVGHVTKSGNIAGPKVIEHIVDTVLFLEMDNRGYYRILRSMKNRFYSTEEIGFFTMEENGLKSIDNVTQAFRYEHNTSVSGISFFPLAEGNRIIPVEIQALTAVSQFNYPKRTSDGMDVNRLFMLIAIMEKNLKINLSHSDIYLNVTNGLKIQDPGLDLAVISAVYSSFKDLPSSMDTVLCGEAGLTGEVRPVIKIDKRISESTRNGFKKIIVPYQANKLKKPDAFTVMPVKNINECISLLF